MKKISLLLFAFGLSLTMFAQTETQFGLKAGVNISKTTNNQGGGTEGLVGFHVGGLAHIHLSPVVALQPEVVYSSQGGKYFINDGEHHLLLNYVNIPLLLQYMAGSGFRIETGPQAGILVSAKDKRSGYETGNVETRDFKNADFSWAFGLGYLTDSGLGIDARYNLGISNINNTSRTAEVKNSVFQFGLFYQFSNAAPRARSGYRHGHR